MQTKCFLPCDEDVQLEATSMKLRLNTPSYLRMVCVSSCSLSVLCRHTLYEASGPTTVGGYQNFGGSLGIHLALCP